MRIWEPFRVTIYDTSLGTRKFTLQYETRNTIGPLRKETVKPSNANVSKELIFNEQFWP